jgi:hypothetical protein
MLIDVDDFNKYRVFRTYPYSQVNKNFTFIGSLWQMDRNDLCGITVLDLSNDTIVLYQIPSPIFKKS